MRARLKRLMKFLKLLTSLTQILKKPGSKRLVADWTNTKREGLHQFRVNRYLETFENSFLNRCLHDQGFLTSIETREIENTSWLIHDYNSYLFNQGHHSSMGYYITRRVFTYNLNPYMDQIGATGKMVGAKQNLVCSFYKLAIGQLCYSPAQDVVHLDPHIYRLFHIKGQRRMRVERIWCYLQPVRYNC